MNEHDFFKQMIHDRAVNDAVVKAKAKMQTKKTAAWRRPLAIAAAAFAVLVGTVFLIPSARAEVLSWFGVSTPQDYLTTNPDDREKIPEIDALISSPEPEDGFRIIPIDRTNSEAVNSEGALKMSDFFYENCDIALGDAMYDGQFFYQTVRMNGLSGLYLLEDYTGGWQTGVQVDPYAVWGLYENGPEEKYLTGEWTLYERPRGRIFYELPDGTRFAGMLELSGAIEPYCQELFDLGLIGMDVPENAQEQINRMNLEYLEQNGVTAVATIWDCENATEYADENGNLTVKVFYEVEVCEEDRGDDNYVPDTELFKAQLGTITVNVGAYQNIEASTVAPADAVVWGAETVTVSRTENHPGEPDDLYADDRVSFSKHLVSANGLTMTVEEIEADALGIRNLKIRITVPEAWTQDEREAFAKSLNWKVLLNSESGSWYVNAYQCNVEEDGTLLYKIGEISDVPYDMMQSIKTITLMPILRIYKSIEVFNLDNHSLGVLNPDYGETVWSERGVCGWNYSDAETEYPQYAITLHVN
ncbi:MAG: hypothetical protein IKP38_00350 [Clostridia bacterium]|nr:hypothetical protein [Clostridia bacterium]